MDLERFHYIYLQLTLIKLLTITFGVTSISTCLETSPLRVSQSSYVMVAVVLALATNLPKSCLGEV